jgi:hypothetical protein
LKKHKPWFDEWCSKLLYQRKQTKLQCLIRKSIEWNTRVGRQWEASNMVMGLSFRGPSTAMSVPI